MVQRGMERRIAGIMMWLERFQSSYRSGALEKALMDAECARADLEDLRHDVWSRVRAGYDGRQRFDTDLFCRLMLSASLIVLTLAAPISRGQDIPASLRDNMIAEQKEPVSNFAVWTDHDRYSFNLLPAPFPHTGFAEPANHEKAPDFSDQERIAEKKIAAAMRPRRSVADDRTARKAPAERRAPEAPGRSAAEKKVPYDKMFSLLETGARALRNEEPTIRIDRKSKKGESSL